jgi:hypothetical protein
MATWLQAVDHLIELSSYIIWGQTEGVNTIQAPDLQPDLVYLKVRTALPSHVRDHFKQPPYHQHFLEIRANALFRLFKIKAEAALMLSGLSLQDFILNQVIAERLLNPYDPFNLGQNFVDRGVYADD